jgi:hypothetical protein
LLHEEQLMLIEFKKQAPHKPSRAHSVQQAYEPDAPLKRHIVGASPFLSNVIEQDYRAKNEQREKLEEKR